MTTSIANNKESGARKKKIYTLYFFLKQTQDDGVKVTAKQIYLTS